MYSSWLCSQKCTVTISSTSLFWFCFLKYSISFLKPVRLRHRSMDCCSPCRPLLPFWLGKGMATPLRCSPDRARFGFSLLAIIICHLSQCFLLGVSTFLAFLPIPSHPISAALSHARMGGVVVPFLSQRGGSTQQASGVWQLCASDRANEQVQRFATAAGQPALPSLCAAVVSVACSSETASSQVLWPKKAVQRWLCCIFLSCVWVVKQLIYPIAEVIKCIWNANVLITCRWCSFADTVAAGFQNYTGGGLLVSFAFFKLEIKLSFLIELCGKHGVS